MPECHKDGFVAENDQTLRNNGETIIEMWDGLDFDRLESDPEVYTFYCDLTDALERVDKFLSTL